jgi:hypothetical protein
VFFLQYSKAAYLPCVHLIIEKGIFNFAMGIQIEKFTKTKFPIDVNIAPHNVEILIAA